MKNVKRILAVLLVACMLLATPVYATGETEATGTTTTGTDGAESTVTTKVPSYINYYNQHVNDAKPQSAVTVGLEDVTGVQNEEKGTDNKDGKDGAVLSKDNEWIEWQVEIPESGIYNIAPTYYPLPDSGRSLSIKLTIDGIAPYVEAQTLALPRVWKDDPDSMMHEKDEKGEDIPGKYVLDEEGKPVFSQDTLGNDIRPSQMEIPEWTTRSFVNELGMYADPYFFYFEAGTHTIRFERVREAALIGSLTLSNAKTLPSYEEYKAQHTGTSEKGVLYTQQAEKPDKKTDSTLYAIADHQDAGTQPNHPTAMLLNTIGGANWSTVGQSITWQVPLKEGEAGWYTLALRARQNANQGLKSHRTLSINGEIPFAEAVNIPFNYDSDWEVYELQKLWLEPGDTITLTVSAGELCDVLRTVQESVLDLNEIYRKIIVITGTSPDVYQDYYLEDEIPGLKEMFLDQQAKIQGIADQIYKANGNKNSSQTSNLYETAEKLGVYAGKSYEITADLGSFKSSIESLSSLLLTFGQQPLEVDCLYYVPEGTKTPSGKAGFFESIWYSIQKFIGSFLTDYQTKGDKGTVEAWVSTGRDQMQIISAMITKFSDDSGINVRLSLVDTGSTLLSATMAGKGPDVALLIPSTEIINLSMRGALVDLQNDQWKNPTKYGQEEGAKYDVYGLMGDHFTEAAWKHFRFYSKQNKADMANTGKNTGVDGIYAIPETQTWPMVFYRTDIFEELDLSTPDSPAAKRDKNGFYSFETWENYYEMLRTLQGQNLNVGMVETSSGTPGVSGSIDIFQSILYQRGSTYYNQDLTATLFDTTPAYEAFEQWSEFYSKYGVERSVDFYNRFRTGDVPIGVISYGTYNQLMAAAPELRGLWKMAPMPGTIQYKKDENGNYLVDENNNRIPARGSWKVNEATGLLARDEMDCLIPEYDDEGEILVNHASASGGSGCMMLTAAQKRGVADEAYKFLTWWTDSEQQTRYGYDLEATMGVAARYTPADLTAFDKMGWTDEEAEVLKEQRLHTQNVYSIPGDYLLARSLTNALRSTLDGNLEPRRTLSQYNRDINAEIKRKRKEFDLYVGEEG